jgi:cytosine/adenosine deaminase-related metal-dependent hydrolase
VAFKKLKDLRNVVAEAPGLIEQAQKLQAQAQGMQAAQMAAGTGAAAAIDPHLLEPIAGVTLEKYAELAKAVGERKLDQAGIESFVQLHGLTPETWQAAYDGWNERFKGNMGLSVHFGTLYQQARSL